MWDKRGVYASGLTTEKAQVGILQCSFSNYGPQPFQLYITQEILMFTRKSIDYRLQTPSHCKRATLEISSCDSVSLIYNNREYIHIYFNAAQKETGKLIMYTPGTIDYKDTKYKE